MALHTTPRPHGVRSFRDRAVSLASTVSTVFSSWSERRDLRARLSRLSAHELSDIGLEPGDLDRLTRR